MNEDTYRAAKQAAEGYAQTRASQPKGSLYTTWTQHISTLTNVLSEFQNTLTAHGVNGGQAQLPYLKRFKQEHGIDDNYYD